MERGEIDAEMCRVQADFTELVGGADPSDLRRRSSGTRWTNRLLLYHMVFGYLIVRTLMPLVHFLGRLGWSRGFAAVLKPGRGSELGQRVRVLLQGQPLPALRHAGRHRAGAVRHRHLLGGGLRRGRVRHRHRLLRAVVRRQAYFLKGSTYLAYDMIGGDVIGGAQDIDAAWRGLAAAGFGSDVRAAFCAPPPEA